MWNDRLSFSTKLWLKKKQKLSNSKIKFSPIGIHFIMQEKRGRQRATLSSALIQNCFENMTNFEYTDTQRGSS